MTRRTKTQPCPVCGGEMRNEKHDDVLTYKAHTKTIQTLGWWCTQCDEGVLSGDDLVAHEKAFLAFRAEVDQVLSPTEVAAVRGKLGLSQRKASELLGGGPRSFQKYEVGTQAVSAPMSNLLRLLDNDPSRLDEIAHAKSRASSRASKRGSGGIQKVVTQKKATHERRTTAKVAARSVPSRKKRASG